MPFFHPFTGRLRFAHILASSTYNFESCSEGLESERPKSLTRLSALRVRPRKSLLGFSEEPSQNLVDHLYGTDLLLQNFQDK